MHDKTLTPFCLHAADTAVLALFALLALLLCVDVPSWAFALIIIAVLLPQLTEAAGAHTFDLGITIIITVCCRGGLYTAKHNTTAAAAAEVAALDSVCKLMWHSTMDASDKASLIDELAGSRLCMARVQV